jgi:hypothetical protein
LTSKNRVHKNEFGDCVESHDSVATIVNTIVMKTVSEVKQDPTNLQCKDLQLNNQLKSWFNVEEFKVILDLNSESEIILESANVTFVLANNPGKQQSLMTSTKSLRT